MPFTPRPALPTRRPHGAPRWALAVAVALPLVLAGCSKEASTTSTGAGAAAGTSAAEVAFEALVAACTQSVAARGDHVAADGQSGWAKTGHSPALVQREVTRTESAITPWVAKIVVKDNEARASAPTAAEAQAITLTPAHLVSNRTHTFVYSFDGQQWRWQNGQRLVKTPGQNDRMDAVNRDDLLAPQAAGFGGCLPG